MIMGEDTAGWSARELSRMTSIKLPTLIHWIGSGLVTPEHFGRGRGGHSIGIAGLMELLAVSELRHAGFSLQEVRRAVDNLRELTGHNRPLAQLTLVVSGNDIAWKNAEELATIPVSVLQSPGQRLMVLPVGKMHSDLVGRLQTSTSNNKDAVLALTE